MIRTTPVLLRKEKNAGTLTHGTRMGGTESRLVVGEHCWVAMKAVELAELGWWREAPAVTTVPKRWAKSREQVGSEGKKKRNDNDPFPKTGIKL